MLGRFLEVGVHAPDILESLAFYESLGFVQARVGDAHGHPYAVVTDGRLHLGLHAVDRDSPSLTWIHPGLAAHARALQSRGIELAYSRLGEDGFHELGFHDPSGQLIVLVEARTYSPPAEGSTRPSALGYFEEFGIPVSDLARAAMPGSENTSTGRRRSASYRPMLRSRCDATTRVNGARTGSNATSPSVSQNAAARARSDTGMPNSSK